MASLPPHEMVILVSHSLGGIPISIAMETFPHKIAAAVFATVDMPGPTLNYSTISKEIIPDKPATSFLHGPEFISFYLYQLSPPEDLTLELTLLRFAPLFHEELILSKKNYGSVRRVIINNGQDLTLELTLLRFAPLFHEELILSKKNYGSVRRVYIKCDQDQTIKEDLARLMINDNPPDEVKVINGSDHMVMFSRPLELFSSLYQIAQNYS